MHPPLGLTLDNIFFRALEQWFLSNCPAEFQPLLYRRYVDDTCCIFKNSKQIGRCLEYLNSQHPKVKFTHDVEEDGSLAFLDVLVIHDHKGYTTNLYLKTTFTGLYTNFNSLSPNQYKNNLITALSEQPHYKYNLNIRTISISEQSQYQNNLNIRTTSLQLYYIESFIFALHVHVLYINEDENYCFLLLH